MKTTILAAAFCLAASAAYAQDKKKSDEPDATLKEVDRRLKAQGDEILRAVQKMLDERLGKGGRAESGKSARGVDLLGSRLKAHREEVLKAVEKMLDERLGKGRKADEESKPGRKKKGKPGARGGKPGKKKKG